MTTDAIPKYLEAEFLAALDAADDDDLPDGAWFAMLEEAAERFINEHRILGADPNDAVHQWVRARSNEVKT